MAINYTPRTWVSGETVTAAEMNTEIHDPLTGIQAVWTTYTPVLTGATTNPSGYTTTGSAYMQIGKTIKFRARIILGASVGSGAYSVTLPVAPAPTTPSLQVLLFDQSAASYCEGFAPCLGANPVPLLTDPTTAGTYARAVTAAAPFTFAASDIIAVHGVYEAA